MGVDTSLTTSMHTSPDQSVTMTTMKNVLDHFIQKLYILCDCAIASMSPILLSMVGVTINDSVLIY